MCQDDASHARSLCHPADILGRQMVAALLSLRFPRAVSAVRDEIALVADRRVRLDWRLPAIAMNDLDAYLRRAAVPKGG